ncbi:GlpF Glycerol uptake facilitator and related permeases (Major Intrinsic Protein Family) [Candidatus Nanopelagicaceae bacterium]
MLAKFAAEFIGTALLVATVVGSGAMAQSLTEDIGIQLLINTISTVFSLGLLIYLFAGLSGSHFNPLVSISEFIGKRLSGKSLALYISAQFSGGVLGTLLANQMFEKGTLVASSKVREGSSIWLGEIVATAGLLLIIELIRIQKLQAAAIVITSWIGAAYFFTSSTSFANPAVTFARAWTDTFAGIAPESVPLFIAFQILGATIGVLTARLFISPKKESPLV